MLTDMVDIFAKQCFYNDLITTLLAAEARDLRY